MKKFSVIAFLLMAGLAAALAPGAFGAADKAQAPAAKSQPSFVAYYFHGTFRCPSCRRIEEWSREAVFKSFAGPLKDGSLKYLAVNVDEEPNAHFVKDFSLYTKSLVIVEEKNGQPVRWKNLEKVWEHLRNQERFSQYVVSEIKAFMGKR